VNHFLNETALLRGFVRFSDFGGGLVATIEPKNNVLPILKYHFLDRYPDGSFIIHDKTHSLVLVAQSGKSRIISVDGFTPPSAEADEIIYRALWKRFYDTIAVEGRENPKCRMNHMPKRYWEHLTEMQPLTGRGMIAEKFKLIG
jgi:probable DNA metabolism protein